MLTDKDRAQAHDIAMATAPILGTTVARVESTLLAFGTAILARHEDGETARRIEMLHKAKIDSQRRRLGL